MTPIEEEFFRKARAIEARERELAMYRPPPITVEPKPILTVQPGMPKAKSRVPKLALLLLIPVVVYAVNYLTIQSPVTSALAADARNFSVRVSAHYGYYVNSGELVLSVTINGTASRLDLFRCVLQTAKALKGKQFDKVVLEGPHHSRYVSGSYFKALGDEYDIENPIYLMRTFPENLHDEAGLSSYSGHSGSGLLGGLQGEMEDLTSAMDDWVK